MWPVSHFWYHLLDFFVDLVDVLGRYFNFVFQLTFRKFFHFLNRNSKFSKVAICVIEMLLMNFLSYTFYDVFSGAEI